VVTAALVIDGPRRVQPCAVPEGWNVWSVFMMSIRWGGVLPSGWNDIRMRVALSWEDKKDFRQVMY